MHQPSIGFPRTRPGTAPSSLTPDSGTPDSRLCSFEASSSMVFYYSSLNWQRQASQRRLKQCPFWLFIIFKVSLWSNMVSYTIVIYTSFWMLLPAIPCSFSSPHLLALHYAYCVAQYFLIHSNLSCVLLLFPAILLKLFSSNSHFWPLPIFTPVWKI